MNTTTSGFCEKCNTRIMVTGPNGNLDVVGCGCPSSAIVPYLSPADMNPVNPNKPFTGSPFTVTPDFQIESRKAAAALQKALNEEAEQEAEIADLRSRVDRLEKTVALMQIALLSRKMKKAKPGKKDKKAKGKKKAVLLKG